MNTKHLFHSLDHVLKFYQDAREPRDSEIFRVNAREKELLNHEPIQITSFASSASPLERLLVARMMRLCFVLVTTALAVVRMEAFVSPEQKSRARALALLATSQTASDASRLKRIATLKDWGKAVDIK